MAFIEKKWHREFNKCEMTSKIRQGKLALWIKWRRRQMLSILTLNPIDHLEPILSTDNSHCVAKVQKLTVNQHYCNPDAKLIKIIYYW